ncbi:MULTISPECIES: VOC family protein [unclassified Mesorhizobium]|uniref:VOC family protein n=1 Tax=unclassified Mesorhizobium TaxID=325217 RepID=UPI0010931E73|nr:MULTISPECIES: VOC family protein [unclassified Mesorhizobium]TGQ28169.1 VOC family protein [Mesorhizobium sp. M4B.F.Ca.ET.214.01.1.1]TGQ55349.1 VOC family protein [Mesorhizobium sp. M4B.F.Ca.ET.211.01.1.1]TGU28704.1 VOC family protein [Mesorhizobium sp. M4B.F.Ca.ET.150.01.1.1]TIX16714.1 MAG: VOC family protein [Mesorhizobium sp.]
MHHVAISVRDLAASLAFYAGFGFEKDAQCQLWDGELTLTVLAGPHGRLELFSSIRPVMASDQMASLRTDLHQIGGKHFALEVSNLASEIQRLRSLGVTVEGDVAFSALGFDYVFVRDPSGNWIELLEVQK